MMQNPIFYASFVNPTQFWIADIKCGIMGMLVGFGF